MIIFKHGFAKKTWTTIKHMPQSLIQYMKESLLPILNSTKMPNKFVPLIIPADSLLPIQMKLAKQIKKKTSLSNLLSVEEKQIVARIRTQTEICNRNNITRTEAYYDIYNSYPELHWAFLAHMVSRNGGWNMTDLKGELLPKLMKKQQAEYLFLFLERANSLIFQDAYPQLLIYAESLKLKKNLFHLLNEFHISAWMKSIWEYVWNEGNKNPALLTAALVINEQNYIEKRVIQHPKFKKYVIDTLLFKTQGFMQLNQVVFPFKASRNLQSPMPMQLAGLILEDFSNLNERIQFGKKLYSILFGFPDILKGAKSFAADTKHSGSRADYWPQLFTKTNVATSSSSYTEKLKGSQLKSGAAPFYSPELIHAWGDRPILPPNHDDWCKDLNAISYLKNIKPPLSFEMTQEHCLGLNKIELAVLAQNQL